MVGSQKPDIPEFSGPSTTHGNNALFAEEVKEYVKWVKKLEENLKSLWSLTPEQHKQKPFEEIFKNQHEKVDTENGESDEEEEKSTTSSEKSEQDSESDTTTEDEEESNTTQTHQIHHVFNETTHDEENVSEPEDDTSQKQNVNEIQTYENNQEQNVQEEKLLTTNFQVKVENRKVEGLITLCGANHLMPYEPNLRCCQDMRQCSNGVQVWNFSHPIRTSCTMFKI